MVQGIIIPAAGDRPLELREFTSLDDYQSVVDGWLEAIALPDLGVTMLVNDEGRVRQLLHNPRASFLRWYWHPLSRASGMLAGDVVLVGLPDRAGDSTDVPERVRESMLSPALFAIEILTDAAPGWYRNSATLPDYWSALIWAMMLTEHSTGVRDFRIVSLARTIDDI